MVMMVDSNAIMLNWTISNTFPHNTNSFTEGLFIDPNSDGTHFFESIGKI